MPVYILVKAIDGFNNPDDPMTRHAGYFIDAKGVSRIGGKQIPPNFVQVEIPDSDDVEGVQNGYCVPWRKEIDWEFVGHNYTIDGHRLNVFIKSEFVSTSGLNSLTLAQVENYLTGWNASIVSTDQNSVVFDVAVFDSLCSNKFWGIDVSLVVFDEKSYNQSTGIHEVEANYSASGFSGAPDEVIEKRITDAGGFVTQHAANKVTFEISRTAAFDVFKLRTKTAIDGVYSPARFKLPAVYIQQAYANAGTLSVNMEDIPTVIYDRLND